MRASQTVTYTNGTQGRLLIVLEPWAEQYWVQPGEQVDIEARNGVPGHHLELEHTAEGLIVYGWEGCVVSILRDGKELGPSPQS